MQASFWTLCPWWTSAPPPASASSRLVTGEEGAQGMMAKIPRSPLPGLSKLTASCLCHVGPACQRHQCARHLARLLPLFRPLCLRLASALPASASPGRCVGLAARGRAQGRSLRRCPVTAPAQHSAKQCSVTAWSSMQRTDDAASATAGATATAQKLQMSCRRTLLPTSRLRARSWT